MTLPSRALCRWTIGLLVSAAFLPIQGQAADEPVVKRGDSTVLRGGPERTGQFPDARLPEHPKVLWKVKTEHAVHDPVFAAGAILVGDNSGAVSSYDAKTGGLLWRADDEAPERRGQVFAAPTVVGEEVLITSQRGVEALARSDGLSLWVFKIKGGANESSPLFVDHKVVAGGKDGKVYALDPANGEEVWSRDIVADAPELPAGFEANGKSSTEAARPVTASSDGHTLFQSIFDQCRVVALDVKTGERQWSFLAKGWIYMAPAVESGLAIFGSQGDEVLAVDKATGRAAWSYRTKARVEAGAAVNDRSVFIGSCDGQFVCLDVKSGEPRWRFDTSKDDAKNRHIYSSPLLCDDSVIFGSGNGYVYALKADTGALKWKLRPVEGSDIVSTPATDGRRLFVITRVWGGLGEDAIVAIGSDEK